MIDRQDERCHHATADAASWMAAVVSIGAWYVAAFLCVFLKYRMLTLPMRAQAAPMAMLADGRTLGEKVSFFRADALIGFLLVPLVLLFAGRYLGRYLRLAAVAVVSIAASIVVFAQVKAFFAVGQFVDYDMFWDAFKWSWSEAGATSDYFTAGGLIKLLLAIVLIVGILWSSTLVDRGRMQRFLRAGRWTLGPSLVFLLLITAVSWLPRPHRWTPYHRSVLWMALKSLAGREVVDTRPLRGLNSQQLMNLYRQLANAPVPRLDLRYVGKAKGYNVIFFIFETAPALCLNLQGDLIEFPNMRRLRENSFVAVSHFTTYPATSNSVFSIFSSTYPSSLGMRLIDRYPHMVVPGIMRILSHVGYETTIYNPERDWWASADAPMFQSLGFRQVIYGSAAVSKEKASDSESRMERKIERDQTTLDRLEQDIRQWSTQGHSFAAAYLPQIGHAPWPDIRKHGAEKDVLKRGQAILALEDAWLGHLLQILEQTRQLDRTIIVITGDHGIRTRVEDPSTDVATINRYSFQVPLLIFVPKVLAHTETVSWITSHIDLQPTVLNLLGIQEGRDLEQGSPIWNSDLVGRATYFFANAYWGVDGYYSRRRYFMWDHQSQAVYATPELPFKEQDRVPLTAPIGREVQAAISKMTALQLVWAEQLNTPQQGNASVALAGNQVADRSDPVAHRSAAGIAEAAQKPVSARIAPSITRRTQGKDRR